MRFVQTASGRTESERRANFSLFLSKSRYVYATNNVCDVCTTRASYCGSKSDLIVLRFRARKSRASVSRRRSFPDAFDCFTLRERTWKRPTPRCTTINSRRSDLFVRYTYRRVPIDLHRRRSDYRRFRQRGSFVCVGSTRRIRPIASRGLAT